MVLAGTPNATTTGSDKAPGTVMGLGVWRKGSWTRARLRHVRRMFELPVGLRRYGFTPSQVILMAKIPFQSGACFGWVWNHHWAGVHLGLAEQSQGHVLYAAHSPAFQPSIFNLSQRLPGKFTLRPIVIYDKMIASVFG